MRILSWPAIGRSFVDRGGAAVSEEKALPVKWSTTENVRWKAELPGRGVSSPVIAAGRVYVTAASAYRQRRLHILCFDAVNGEQLWERQLAATGSTMCHPKTSMAAPTPVTDGKSVYALFATGDLAAFNRDGDLLWYRALARDYPDITNQVGMAASPVLAGETLLLPLENAGDSFALGVDVKTGRNRWKVPRRRDINWVTPIVTRFQGKTAALFQTSGEITAYDASNGEVLWSYKGTNLGSVPSPAILDDLVIVPGNPSVALRVSEGGKPEVAWKSRKLAAAYRLAGGIQGSHLRLDRHRRRLSGCGNRRRTVARTPGQRFLRVADHRRRQAVRRQGRGRYLRRPTRRQTENPRQQCVEGTAARHAGHRQWRDLPADGEASVLHCGQKVNVAVRWRREADGRTKPALKTYRTFWSRWDRH